ncbi:hypothetical protein CMI45_03125 [Candidatus Pacearchaeota archaeon]|nr:hypothetical protein [Candidatus Pacearchaeota archaeon]|tara:strand:- start:6726 stop:8156 length:1431 start_codon:yes stop_codon:yes gene_type:complete
MVSAFTIYDLVFLVIFTLAVTIFLYTHRKNLKREGILYLYRTSFGINFIEKFTKRFSKILKPSQYIVILSGYFLMVSMVWLLLKVAWIYITSPIAASALKVPVIFPLVPYLPDLFKIDFLPSFNFTYWILIIAVLAIPHEFAHGIFARLNNIRIHSTGFGFLGPFLAAFVEQDEKDMGKSSRFAQLSVLAAGTFANVLTLILFAFIFWIFFISAFTPVGLNFTGYSSAVLNTSDLNLPDTFSLDNDLLRVEANGKAYIIPSQNLKQTLENNLSYILVFDDAPAINVGLGVSDTEELLSRQVAISTINGEKVTSYESLASILSAHSPGDNVTITTISRDSVRTNNIERETYNLELGERDGKAFLGIKISNPKPTGILGGIYSSIGKIKDPLIFFDSNLGSFGWFIYYFLWWTVLILASVALVNMLPVGIFDGGRFFYLTIWALTGSEKVGKAAFTASTWLILGIVAAMMVKWLLIFI